MSLQPGILECIGDTRLVPLHGLAPEGTRILLKLESENPTGSIKDRMDLAMVEAAEKDGRLAPGQPVVEYTGGSTGVSLAFVCAVKNHPLHVVSSDVFAQEKLDHMVILGAHLHLVPSDTGGTTEKLTRDMIEAARSLAKEVGGYWTDQLNNEDQVSGYGPMADEIWEQTNGEVDAFVHMVGTAGSIRGISEGLRRYDSRVRVIAVEPSESPVLSAGRSGSHQIDGVAPGFVMPLWKEGIADRIDLVSTEEAREMSLRLAREEGLFGGTSTGGNVVAARRAAEELGPGATVVTIMVDTGMKYLDTFKGASQTKASEPINER